MAPADRVFRNAEVLAPPSVVPAARRPVALGGEAGHGWLWRSRDEREPGRDARMPPGRKDGFPDGWDAGRVHRDPGRSGTGTDAGQGSSSGTGLCNVAVEHSCAVSVAGAHRVRLPGASASQFRRRAE
jgi:hypothetical protein